MLDSIMNFLGSTGIAKLFESGDWLDIGKTLFMLLLSGEHKGADLLEGASVTQKTCPNGRCISHTEQELPVYSKNGRCVWCDEELK